LRLSPGEKIVGVVGDISYLFNCDLGFWRDLKFLISNGTDYEEYVHDVYQTENAMADKWTRDDEGRGNKCD